jgi:hypothetical protein
MGSRWSLAYFSESDKSDSPPVAIVDEASPGLEREPTPHVYEWSRQAGPIDDWVVRTSGDPPCATPKPHAAISGLISMEGQLEVQTSSRRFRTWLLGLSAAIGLTH